MSEKIKLFGGPDDGTEVNLHGYGHKLFMPTRHEYKTTSKPPIGDWEKIYYSVYERSKEDPSLFTYQGRSDD